MSFDDISIQAEEIRNLNKLSKKDAQTLRNLEIHLESSVLPQHEIESRAGSRPPTHKEIERFTQFVSLKKGCYHPSEDKIINKNWKTFCKLHTWDPSTVQPFLLLREGNATYIRSKKQRRKFVQFLANGLPNRTLYSVYHRFRNLFADRVQRRFLPEEDEMIINHLEHNSNLDEKRKYSDLAQVLKRTRASIWRRYKLLQRKRKNKLHNNSQ
ncbi:uncharacterized protein LOC116428505 [Nomia melanderi]|uniref:uncharacterized protein LOC116428505 n=1 Tax=Nomia melanderi TaxID=2448451 RepID=UPI001303F5F5|nr:uncharacterized protein LOC116428505 [Nomia melanderi]XP_031836187.1 uncharacterized protein LOC116428505 [Nomia melanderi]